MGFDYESDWMSYVYPDSDAEFIGTEKMKDKLTRLDLRSESDDTRGGIPLICDGRTAYVNNNIEHTIIYGESGSGKSWSLIFPLIPLLARGNTSMFITDVKGELSADRRIRGYLEHVSRDVVVVAYVVERVGAVEPVRVKVEKRQTALMLAHYCERGA